MRRIAIATLSLTALALTGCGTNTTSHGENVSQDQKVAAYNSIAKNVNGFVVASIDNAPEGPDPKTAAEAISVADYTFTDGVTLTEYDADKGMCFTGPHDTFMTLGGEETMQRTFGTGKCDYTDGDIVLALDTDSSAKAPISVMLKSDTKGVATAVEMYMIANPDTELTDVDAKFVADQGIALSKGNTVKNFTSADGAYSFCVLNDESGVFALYDSANGGLREEMGTGGSCSPDAKTTTDANDGAYVEKVVKGEALAKQVPAIDDFAPAVSQSLQKVAASIAAATATGDAITNAG